MTLSFHESSIITSSGQTLEIFSFRSYKDEHKNIMNLRENKFSLQAEFKFYPFELHLDLTEDKCKLDWILLVQQPHFALKTKILFAIFK